MSAAAIRSAHATQAPRLSICVPCHRAEPAFLPECLASVEAAAPEDAELILAVDAEDSLRRVRALRLSPRWRLLEPDGKEGLVPNWNRCLATARGAHVHLLHEDDAVAPTFYAHVCDLIERFPDAALHLTATTSSPPPPGGRAEGRLLQGEDAARFLLDDVAYACGSVVIARRAVEALGFFDGSYSFCPDEEAYLRWARHGGLVASGAPLYRSRRHVAQERFRAWRRPDFVETYARARLQGAAAYGAALQRYAVRTTQRRVVSIALTLALEGDRAQAADVLRDALRGRAGVTGVARVLCARLVIASTPLLRIARSRRRRLATRRVEARQVMSA